MGRKGSAPKGNQKTKEAAPSCPKCGQDHAIRSGTVQGSQRWKCRGCSYQYTRTAPRGRPLWQKSLAVFLHSQGMPLNTIGGIFHVQPSTVLKWVRQLAGHPYSKQDAGNVVMMDLSAFRQRLGGSGEQDARKDAGTLCIAIDDKTFRKNMGISITRPDGGE